MRVSYESDPELKVSCIMFKRKKCLTLDSDAVFIGWQETLSGEAIALYDITAESHPSYGSTVTNRMLRDLKLQIPERNHHTKPSHG